MKKLRIAVVGAGHLGRIHARLLAGLEGVELTAIADPVAEACRQAAADTGAEPVADYRDLAGRVDAAIVATPTCTHLPVGRELLQHGIHLLVEKPLAPTAAEAEELVWTADWHGALLQVGHVERFNPALELALPAMRQPRFIEATRHSPYTFRSTDIGVVFDLMIHDIDLVLSLVDSPVSSVQAVGWTVMGGHEDVARARVEFANGCVAQFSVSRVNPLAMRQMEVWGADGQVTLNFATRRATLLHPSDQVTSGQFDPQRVSPAERKQLQEKLFQEFLPLCELEAPEQNALLEEQRDFVGCIREGRTPRVSGAAGLEAVRLAERVVQCIAEHRWEEMPPKSPAAAVSPAAEPTILRGPHWHLQPQSNPPFRKEAV